MTGTATTKQISYIAALEAKSGHRWTEYVHGPAGANLDAMPKAIASKVIGALLAECLPQARTASRMIGQSGRCLDCGTHLDRLSRGGYCFDCQS